MQLAASTSDGCATLRTLRQAFWSLWLDVPDTDEGWTLSVWQARPLVYKFNRRQSLSMLAIDHGETVRVWKLLIFGQCPNRSSSTGACPAQGV